MRIGLITFVFVAFAVAMAPSARAQSDDAKKQAQALQVEGVRLLQKGDNRGALAKFNEAFALVQSPKIMFNMGKAYRALGDDVEALRAYDTFLDEAPYAPKASRAEAEREVQSLRPKLAYIEIEAEDSGGTVRIDGRDVGKTPLTRAVVVAPGAHEVKVEKTGMVTEKRSVTPIAGQKVRVVVKLSAVPVPEKPPVVAARPPIDTPPPPRLANNDADTTQPIERHPGGIENPPVDTPPSGRPWQYTAAWVSVGLGAVALGAGITAQVLWSQKNNEFNSVKNAAGGPQCTTSMPPDFGGGNCLSLHQAADLRLTLAIAGYATAGAAAIAGLVFYLTAPSAGEGHAPAGNSVSLGCLPTALSAGTSGLSCAFTTRF